MCNLHYDHNVKTSGSGQQQQAASSSKIQPQGTKDTYTIQHAAYRKKLFAREAIWSNWLVSPCLAQTPKMDHFRIKNTPSKQGVKRGAPWRHNGPRRVPTWSPKASQICKKCPPKLGPKAYCQKTSLYKHSNYENMTPVQAGALFSLCHPTSKKPPNRSKMHTKTDQKLPKPCPGHHFQITLCTAHPHCAKICKTDIPKAPQNETNIR